MKYIHLELSNLIGLFERTMVQIYIYTDRPDYITLLAGNNASIIGKILRISLWLFGKYYLYSC